MKVSKRAFQKAEAIQTKKKSLSHEIPVDMGEFPPFMTTHQPTKTKINNVVTQAIQKNKRKLSVQRW